MKLTKNDMARVVVQAMYMMPELPTRDHRLVVKIAKRKALIVEAQYRVAWEILNQNA